MRILAQATYHGEIIERCNEVGEEGVEGVGFLIGLRFIRVFIMKSANRGRECRRWINEAFYNLTSEHLSPELKMKQLLSTGSRREYIQCLAIC